MVWLKNGNGRRTCEKVKKIIGCISGQICLFNKNKEDSRGSIRYPFLVPLP